MTLLEEDENYSQMKNNIISQSSRIAEILSHAGKFKAYYDELTNNVVDSMNTMIKSYMKKGKNAILIDIYDGVAGSIDFENLKLKFKSDMSSKNNLVVPKYEEVNFNLDSYNIDQYDTDILVNMFQNLDVGTVKKFARFQDEAIANLSAVVDDLTNFENGLCAFRTNAIQKMKNNVDVLYAIHVNYAKAVLKKSKNIPECVTVGSKNIKLMKSQREFILNGLKTLIGI